MIQSSVRRARRGTVWRAGVGRSLYEATALLWLGLSLLVCGCPTLAGPRLAPSADNEVRWALDASTSGGQQSADVQVSGRVTGRVVDRTGVAVSGATVRLTPSDQSLDQQIFSDSDGRFSFSDIRPGEFRLAVSSAGFATQTLSGNLHPRESHLIPQIVLAIATKATEIRVVPSQIEVAEEQIKEQEKQRALGFIPNFYVSYIPNAAPLTSKQKFKLAGKLLVDPVTFGVTGAIAGVQQANDTYSGYGQGAQGYAKRYGAVYADTAMSTLLGSAVLPSILKQDPRYFYKPTGSKRARVLYAVANSVICKGDNGKWQPNYSSILGSLAAGGISNLYYPPKDRGAKLTFENTAIGIGATAVINILQEFVVRKLTPNLPKLDPGKP